VLFAAGLLGDDGSKDVFQIVDDALFLLAMPVVSATVAALIVSRQPRNTIGWLLMVLVGSFLVGEPLTEYIERLAPSFPAPTLPLLVTVWFSGWSWLLLIFPLLQVMLLFPSGQPPTPRWRWVGVAVFTWAALFVLLATLAEPIRSNTTPEIKLDNPIGVLGQGAVDRLAGVWIAGLVVLVILCVAALFVRYRRANVTEREQIKWLLYACAVFLAVYVGGAVTGIGGGESIASRIWGVFFGLSLVTLPAAIGIAVLRYHLWDIEVIIRRTLVYGMLTAMLALLYFGGVALLQYLSRSLTGGQAEQPQWAIVASTLAIAALFQPLRRRIQGFIDHRFYRRKYDATKTLQDFSTRLRDEVELGVLSEDLLTVVHETVQPEHASLWLRSPEARR